MLGSRAAHTQRSITFVSSLPFLASCKPSLRIDYPSIHLILTVLIDYPISLPPWFRPILFLPFCGFFPFIHIIFLCVILIFFFGRGESTYILYTILPSNYGYNNEAIVNITINNNKTYNDDDDDHNNNLPQINKVGEVKVHAEAYETRIAKHWVGCRTRQRNATQRNASLPLFSSFSASPRLHSKSRLSDCLYEVPNQARPDRTELETELTTVLRLRYAASSPANTHSDSTPSDPFEVP